MSTRKKAQMINSEIFIYILALIIFSLILLYGYNAISKFRSETNTVSLLQFKNELTNIVEKLGYEYGTIEKKELTLPSGYSKICFATLSEPYEITMYSGSDIGSYPIIQDSLSSNVKNNVFLISNGKIEPFYIGGITVEPNNFNCYVAVSGKVNVKFEAKGKTVLVS
jgi:hypothetical protein